VLAYIKNKFPADIGEQQARINQETGNEPSLHLAEPESLAFKHLILAMVRVR